MFATTREKLLRFQDVPAPDIDGEPSAAAAETTPGAAFVVTLPAATGLVRWRVTFLRGSGEDKVAVFSQEVPPDESNPTDVGYLFALADVGEDITPQVTAFTLSPSQYPNIIFTLEPITVTDFDGENPAPEDWPADLSPDLFAWQQREDGPTYRGELVVGAAVPADPSGYELTAYHAKMQGGVLAVNGELVKTLTELSGSLSGAPSARPVTWSPNSGVALGEQDGVSLGYKSTAGEKRQFAWTKSFIAATVVVPPPPTGDPANVTVAATEAALISAIDARIAANNSATWIIDWQSGTIPSLTLKNKKPIGKIIIRAADRASLGTIVRKLRVWSCNNIEFHFINFDRRGLGRLQYPVQIVASNGIHFWYCQALQASAADIVFLNPGYFMNADNFFAWNNVTGGEDATVSGVNDSCGMHMCYLDVVVDKAIKVNGTFNSVFEDLVGGSVGVDFIQSAWHDNNTYRRLWCPRAKYPDWNGVEIGHPDACQIDMQNAGVAPVSGDVFEEIVVMQSLLGGYLNNSTQGPFCSKSYIYDCTWRRCFVMNNCHQGIWADYAAKGTGGHVVEDNTCIHVIEAAAANAHKGTYISVGSGTVARNVVHHNGGGGSGGGGLAISVPGGTDFTGALTYFENCNCLVGGQMSSFYESRPKTGQATHWDFGGSKVGCWELFAKVIEDGAYPKIGPAAAGWKIWFDPKNQITS